VEGCHQDKNDLQNVDHQLNDHPNRCVHSKIHCDHAMMKYGFQVEASTQARERTAMERCQERVLFVEELHMATEDAQQVVREMEEEENTRGAARAIAEQSRAEPFVASCAHACEEEYSAVERKEGEPQIVDSKGSGDSFVVAGKFAAFGLAHRRQGSSACL